MRRIRTIRASRQQVAQSKISTLPQCFGHPPQRSVQSVLTRRAGVAYARNTANFGRKPLQYFLRHRLREAPATVLARGQAALVTVTTERTTAWIDWRFFHDQPPGCSEKFAAIFFNSKFLAEGDLAVDADLIGGGAPLEEVGQLLDVL